MKSTAREEKSANYLGNAGLMNAGMFGPSGSIYQVPLNAWAEVMNVNLNGMFIAAQLAFGHMRNQSPQGGRIINNG